MEKLTVFQRTHIVQGNPIEMFDPTAFILRLDGTQTFPMSPRGIPRVSQQPGC